MEDELDTFDNGTYTEGDANVESFDDSEESQDDGQAEKGQDSEKAGKESKGEEVDSDSQVNNLEVKEEKKSEEDEEEDPDKSDKEDKSDEEGSKDDEKSADDVSKDDGSPAGKTLKGIVDGKKVEVPEDTTFRVRVDGKATRVPIQELINNYSGKVAYDQKFSELGEEKKAFESQNQQFIAEKDEIISDIQEMRSRVLGVFDGKNKPADAVAFMLDKMGVDSFKYKKAVMEQQAEEFMDYIEMDEVERELYWQKEENKHLQQSQGSLKARSEEEQNRKEAQSRIESAREAHGISEEQYNETSRELADLEDVTPETIAGYAAMKPFTELSTELMEPYKDQLSDDALNSVIVDIARDMFANREITKEEMAQILEEEFALDDYIQEANSKVIKEDSYRSPKRSKEAEPLDMFED